MSRRGWERVVGVAQGRQFVAVYLPRSLRTVNRMACCVAVLNEQDLVVASARGNLEPLLALATQRLQGHDLSLGCFSVEGFVHRANKGRCTPH